MRAFLARSAGAVIAAVALLLLTAGSPQAAARIGTAPLAAQAIPAAPVLDRSALVQPVQYYGPRRYYRPRYYGYRRYYRPRYYGYRRPYYRPRYYGYRRY